MNIVTAVFDSVSHAEGAVRDLQGANFGADHIGIVTNDDSKGRVLAGDLGRTYTRDTDLSRAALTSNADIYCELPTSFVDVITRSTLPDEAINWYRGHVDAGMVLVTVNAGDRMPDAARILQSHGGELYGTEHMGTARGETKRTTGTERVMDTNEGDRGREVHFPVVEEEVHVEKTARQVGEVRVSSVSDTREVDIPTTVEHDEVRVERRRLDRPVRPEEYAGGDTGPGEIRMPIIEEEVRVTKSPVVREELVITRVRDTERTTVHEKVKHTEPHVETTGDVDIERKDEERGRPAA